MFLERYDKFYYCASVLSSKAISLTRASQLQHELILMWREVDPQKASEFFEKQLQEGENGYQLLNRLSLELLKHLPEEQVNRFRGRLLC